MFYCRPEAFFLTIAKGAIEIKSDNTLPRAVQLIEILNRDYDFGSQRSQKQNHREKLLFSSLRFAK